MNNDVAAQLQSLQTLAAPVVALLMHDPNAVVFDLTEANQELAKVDLTDTAAFTAYIFDAMAKADTEIGYGQYGEDRTIYRRSKHFDSKEAPRSFHLGLDIWGHAGTPVFAPLEGTLHSLKNNNNYGDYGPTLILKHSFDGFTFHTLYGHLSRKSLEGKEVGQLFIPGEQIGTLGEPTENVEWPPHLHFQIVLDMKGMKGDFPGVCNPAEAEPFMQNSPDPNLLLGVDKLKK